MRRAGVFDRSTYSVITPHSFGDDDVSLQRAWYSWVRQESLKRYLNIEFSDERASLLRLIVI